MRPGQRERKEFEYLRHGTQTADPPGGRLQEESGGCLDCQFRCRSWRGDSRECWRDSHWADYLEHVKQTVATDPQANKWHLVMDCLNTHQSESLVRYVAEVEGLTWIWVLKANQGFSNPCKPAPFLSDPTHRKRVTSRPSIVPGSTRWRFGSAFWCVSYSDVLVSQVLQNLKMRILEFIDYFNRTMAKPFQWTYKGKALSRIKRVPDLRQGLLGCKLISEEWTELVRELNPPEGPTAASPLNE